MASVELRKRIGQKNGALWLQVPQDMRETMKAKLLEIVSHEQMCVSRSLLYCFIRSIFRVPYWTLWHFALIKPPLWNRPIVRHAISRVIAVIAELELENTRWPALLPWLNEMTSSTIPASREVGIFVIYTCLESIINSQPTIIYEFIQHFTRLLEDPQSLEVRITSLRYVYDSMPIALLDKFSKHSNFPHRSMVVVAQYLESENKREVVSVSLLKACDNTLYPNSRLHSNRLYQQW